MNDWHPPDGSDHIVLVPPSRPCPGCGEKPSRLIRCRKCRCVIGRCGSHGANMERARDEHEAGCR